MKRQAGRRGGHNTGRGSEEARETGWNPTKNCERGVRWWVGWRKASAVACSPKVFICWLMLCDKDGAGSLWGGKGWRRHRQLLVCWLQQGGCQPSAGAVAGPLPSLRKRPHDTRDSISSHRSSQEDDVPPDLTDKLWRMNPKSTAAALQQQAGGQEGQVCGADHVDARFPPGQARQTPSRRSSRPSMPGWHIEAACLSRRPMHFNPTHLPAALALSKCCTARSP
jgi:hypothetical protein